MDLNRSVLTIMAAIGAFALAAPGPAPAAEASQNVQTAGDLLDLCADPGDAAQIACKFYVLGALQSAAIMHAADTHRPDAPLYCASDTTTNGDLIASIRTLVQAHPERRDFPAASVVVGGAMEAYPCKHAPGARHHHASKPAGKTHGATK